MGEKKYKSDARKNNFRIETEQTELNILNEIKAKIQSPNTY